MGSQSASGRAGGPQLGQPRPKIAVASISSSAALTRLSSVKVDGSCSPWALRSLVGYTSRPSYPRPVIPAAADATRNSRAATSMSGGAVHHAERAIKDRPQRASE